MFQFTFCGAACLLGLPDVGNAALTDGSSAGHRAERRHCCELSSGLRLYILMHVLCRHVNGGYVNVNYDYTCAVTV